MSKSGARKKYYVVIRGRSSGIFDSWEECRNQIQCHENNWYQSFPTAKRAVDYFQKYRGVTDAESGYLCCLEDRRYDFFSAEELIDVYKRQEYMEGGLVCA